MKFQIILIAIASATIIGGGLYIKSLRSDLKLERFNTEFAKKERDFAIKSFTQCKADQKITSEVSNEYQNEITNLNSRLADAKRMFSNSCVPVSAGASSRRNESAEDGKPAGTDDRRDFASSETLLDIAAEGEQYRVQVIACQAFIRKTWDSRLNK